MSREDQGVALGIRLADVAGGAHRYVELLLKRPKVLIFDEATSNLDNDTAEQFARTVKLLKGQATMLFITHQVPAGLKVDEVVTLRVDQAERPRLKRRTRSWREKETTNEPGSDNATMQARPLSPIPGNYEETKETNNAN